MSLIKCSECGKDISDKAEACPVCGNPINNRATEIEFTSKRLKKKQLTAIILLFVGIFTMLYSVPLGLFIVFISIIFGVMYRVGAWWNNG